MNRPLYLTAFSFQFSVTACASHVGSTWQMPNEKSKMTNTSEGGF